MTDEMKSTIDLASGGVTVGAFFDALPEVAALFALVWWVIRIWETDTVQKLFKGE